MVNFFAKNLTMDLVGKPLDRDSRANTKPSQCLSFRVIAGFSGICHRYDQRSPQPVRTLSDSAFTPPTKAYRPSRHHASVIKASSAASAMKPLNIGVSETPVVTAACWSFKASQLEPA